MLNEVEGNFVVISIISDATTIAYCVRTGDIVPIPLPDEVVAPVVPKTKKATK
jgi:hypothetical protein